MLESMASIDKDRAEKGFPLGLSEPRWRVLNCIAEHHPRPAPMAALRLCSGLNRLALAEHLQALRWRGLVMFESNALSPSAWATVADYRANLAEVQKRAAAPFQLQPYQERIAATLEASRAGDPADVPACIRPDCTPLAAPVRAKGRSVFAPGLPHGPRAKSQLRGKLGTVIVDEFSQFDSDRGSSAVERPCQGTEPCPPVIAADTSDGARPIAPVRIRPPVNPIKPTESAARPEAPAATGAEGHAPVAAPVNPPIDAPAAPARLPAQPWRGRDIVAERAARLDAAIAWLKARMVLVTVVSRDAEVRQYRVSGKRDNKFAEEVIEIAIDMGWPGMDSAT